MLLNLLRDTFPACQDSETLKPLLRTINDSLLLRDFETAFGSEQYRESYVLRWSPSRALAYTNVLAGLCTEEGEDQTWANALINQQEENQPSTNYAKDSAKVVCFGGGAAEIIAFAGLLRQLRLDAARKPEPGSSSLSAAVLDEAGFPLASDSVYLSTSASLLDLHIVDMADWSSVISKLHIGLQTPPILSKYASAAARASNIPFLTSGMLKPTFTQANIFASSTEELRSMIGPSPSLITLLFTLSDLYSDSIPRTTAFLLKLTMATPEGSVLLVVDSPESHPESVVKESQEATRNNETKSFPMVRLMNHVLIGEVGKDVEGSETKAKWRKITTMDNRFHKLEERLKYPLSLENLRFQVHLYKRL